MQAVFVFQLVLFTFAVHSDNVKCYFCNSDNELEKNCNDPFDKKISILFECTPSIQKTPANMYKSAVKLVNATIAIPDISDTAPINSEYVCAKIHYEYGQKKWLVRDCVPKSGDFCFYLKRISRRMGSGLKIPSCEICAQDGCNEAGGAQAVSLAILVPCVALVLNENH